jgi:predicted phage gp36 major capsid-like protein
MKKHEHRAASRPASGRATPRAVVHARPRADATDPKALVEQIQAAFAEFKATQEGAEGEGRRPSSPRSSASSTPISPSSPRAREGPGGSRPARLGGGGAGKALTPEAAAHSKAFNGWFRKGTEPANMRELEVKRR